MSGQGVMLRASLIFRSLFSSSTGTGVRTCISCGKGVHGDCGMSLIKCRSCGSLLPAANHDLTYFSLFCIPPNFSINSGSLRHQFIKLQRLLHPDNFAAAAVTGSMQAMSADWSALLNRAYETLKDPERRASYLYRTETGEDIIEDTSTVAEPPQELLAEVMDTRLELEDASDPETVRTIMKTNQEIINNLFNDMKESFCSKDFARVKDLLIELRYRKSIDQVAKDVLEDLVA